LAAKIFFIRRVVYKKGNYRGLFYYEQIQAERENIIERAQKSRHTQADAYDQKGKIFRFFFSRPGNLFHFFDRTFNIFANFRHIIKIKVTKNRPLGSCNYL